MVLKYCICVRRRHRNKKAIGFWFVVLSMIILCSVLLITQAPQHSAHEQLIPSCKQQSTCHKEATCHETLLSYICKCNPGFYGNGNICYDLDECKQENALCGNYQKCVNSYGTFQCVCNDGFYDIGNLVCHDIDECDIKNPCNGNGICQNTIGSYKCICKTGREGVGCKEKVSSDASRTCHLIKSNDFPNCEKKVDWMRDHWKSHKCYSEMGVDGSQCSWVYYLSEIENECPLQPGRKKRTFKIEKLDEKQQPVKAKINHFDKVELISRILSNHDNFEWMKNRISSMWNDWVVSYKHLLKKENLQNRTEKRILVYIGMLTDKKWAWAKHVSEGGPLGELVQWSDLIVSLYLLGHHITVPASEKLLLQKTDSPCGGYNVDFTSFDLIYTDIRGLSYLEKKGAINEIKCKLRVVDTFGTEARFNFKGDIDESEVSLNGNKDLAEKAKKDPYGYGYWGLQLKQFFTMFPHSPDNSFLGFAVSRKTTDENIEMDNKNDSAVVYGKKTYMWHGHDQYLATVYQHVHVIGTVAKKEKEKITNIPGFVENRGLLNWDEYQTLLKKAKIFVGLGFPFEGPAPLEAISKGVVFLNPKYNPPLNRFNDRVFDRKNFFDGKPTLRQITSQHPYMEEFVGKPHVYTLDISNGTEVSGAIQDILQKFRNNEIKPYLPYEYTHVGMLQRLNVYVENQDFCNVDSTWPSEEALIKVTSKPNESCKTACKSKGLICDNAMFSYLNKHDAFHDIRCNLFNQKKSLLAPYFNVVEKSCTLQGEPLLYSCVDAAMGYIRLCPCRQYTKGQVALCPKCHKK